MKKVTLYLPDEIDEFIKEVGGKTVRQPINESQRRDVILGLADGVLRLSGHFDLADKIAQLTLEHQN